MQMRPEIQIKSIIKAIKDVVIPAIDPANQLAIEQSRLVIGMLTLMASQLPVQFRFDHDELARLVKAAESLQAIQASDKQFGDSARNLATCKARAATVLERCQADPSELTAAVREMRETIGQLVLAVTQTGTPEVQLKIERVILDLSKEQLLRDRSLMKLQGFEPDPAAIPEIASLLGNRLAQPA